MTTVKEYHDLSLDQIYRHIPSILEGYCFDLSYNESIPVKYSIYILKNGKLVISYAILSYHETGIRNYYDDQDIIDPNIIWFLEYMQTEEGYNNQGYGKVLISHICESLKEPIALISLNSSKIFWSRCGFRILDLDCFLEDDKVYMVGNVSRFDQFSEIHTRFNLVFEKPEMEWYLSLYLSREISLEKCCSYFDYEDGSDPKDNILSIIASKC